MEIKKVYKNKISKQKLVTIPKNSNIEEGDFVEIKKIESESNNAEQQVKKFFEEGGYKVEKNNPKGQVGIPDFKISNEEETFYVEVKTISEFYGNGLSSNQREMIRYLISEWNCEIILAEYDDVEKSINLYKIDENIGRTFINKIPLWIKK